MLKNFICFLIHGLVYSKNKRDFRNKRSKKQNRGCGANNARHGLARAIFFGKQGELRERTVENQLQRASALNIIINAISIWNTLYLEKAIEYRKKEGNYYIMMMSSGGWECHPVDATILSNGDMRLDSGPFGSYYVITKDTSEFRTYSANDKLIDSDKRQLNYNYMDYPAYYLFHTVYGYNGKFIPLPPK